jgi:hypothetical protein
MNLNKSDDDFTDTNILALSLVGPSSRDARPPNLASIRLQHILPVSTTLLDEHQIDSPESRHLANFRRAMNESVPKISERGPSGKISCLRYHPDSRCSSRLRMAAHIPHDTSAFYSFQ